MSKNTEIQVRLHSQEREWLLNLGNGNIVEGVRNLVEQVRERQLTRNDYRKDRDNKLKLWGHR